MEKIALLQEKKELLLKAINQLEASGDSLEKRIDAIEANELVFNELKRLEIKIQEKNTIFPSRQEVLEEEIMNLLQTLHTLTSEANITLKREHSEAKNAISELNKSKRMADGYIQVNHGSVYVDKDFE